MEVGELLHGAGFDERLVAAGLLHDAVERGQLSEADLRAEMDDEICALVMALTEDATIEPFGRRKEALREQVRAGGTRAVTIFAADKLSDIRGLARGVVRSEDSIEARMGTSVEAMTRHYEDSVRTIETTDPSCHFIPELRAELDALGLATAPAAPPRRNEPRMEALRVVAGSGLTHETMPSAPTKPPPVDTASAEERAAAGKAAREKVPRSSHGEWKPAARRRDPVKVLEDQAKSRVPELVPIRYGRMLASPFTFFRGAAAIMAMDLAKTPESGLQVQVCGDAHLSNFGVFAAPDRRLVLDVNDFDETLPGPWEWDVKRLAASFAIAGRDRDFTPKETRAAVLSTVRSYREAMREFAAMRNLDVWYARLDVDTLLADLAKVADRKQMKAARKNVAKAGKKNSLKAFDRLVRVVDGEPRIISDPPLLVPAGELVSEDQAPRARGADPRDDRPLPREPQGGPPPPLRQLPVRRDGPQGGRGRQRRNARLGAADDGPRRAGPALHAGQGGRGLGARALRRGERVRKPRRAGGRGPVADAGLERHPPRLASGDSASDGGKRDFYVRQLWDGKRSVEVETLPPEGLAIYGRVCGWTLARAHARSGDRIAIGAYLGKGESFDRAIADFSERYADQNELDYGALADAAKSGRIEVETDLD